MLQLGSHQAHDVGAYTYSEMQMLKNTLNVVKASSTVEKKKLQSVL